MASILPFERLAGGPLTTFVIRANDDDIREPLWRGLWELDYPTDRALNPYLRFGINNGDGEHLAVWRAAAWAMLSDLTVSCIPMYYRDRAATTLGISPTDVVLIDWEYDLDTEAPDFESADRGFVRGRSCVPIRPEPSAFEKANAGRAGLFSLRSFDDLTAVELAVGGDANSEIALFGLRSDEQRRHDLTVGLRSHERPVLETLLLPDEWFIDLSVVRDRFLGTFSHFVVRSSAPDLPDRLTRITNHYDEAWRRYEERVPSIDDFVQFTEAIEALLAPPG